MKHLFLFFVFVHIALILNAQNFAVFEDWVTNSGTQNIFIESFSIVDSSNNIYVGGSTLNYLGNYDILLTKYDSRGDSIWSFIYNGTGNGDDGIVSVKIDNNENVFLIGFTYTSSTNDKDIIVLKLDNNGDIMWVTTYNGNSSSIDGGVDLFVDEVDNVYACGSTFSNTSLYDFVIMKIDELGNIVWTNTWDGYNFTDVPVKIECYNDKVFATGGSQTNVDRWEYVITSFDKYQGGFIDEKFTTTYSTGYSEVRDLLIDSIGDIYITGSIETDSTGYDIKTIKLDTNLSVIWQASYNGFSDFNDKACSLTRFGNEIWVTGYTTNSEGNRDVVIISYNDSSGAQNVIYTYNSPANGNDEANDICVSNCGDLIIVGTTFNGSNYDYITQRVKPNGQLVWETIYNGILNKNDKALRICIDNEGDIIVVGQCQSDNYSYITIKYKEILIPSVFIEDSPLVCYIENRGQLTDTNGIPNTGVRYYSENVSPSYLFYDNKLSLMFMGYDSLTIQGVYKVDISLMESNANSEPKAFNKHNYYTNYFINETSTHRARLSNYKNLIYPEIYSEIDMVITSDKLSPTVRFVVHPGGNIEDVQLKIEGCDSIYTDSNQNLALEYGAGIFIFNKATAFQINSNGDTIGLSWSPEYSISYNSNIEFLCGNFDNSMQLIIEFKQIVQGNTVSSIENLEWSTYFGKYNSQITKIFGQKDVFFIGKTMNIENIPGEWGFSSTIGGDLDCFIVKVDESLTTQCKTYIGGTNEDIAYGIGINSNSKVVISGYSNSSNFPIVQRVGSYHDHINNGLGQLNYDIFITELNYYCDNIDWSTFYGAESVDETTYDMKVDGLSNIYLVGRGNSLTPLVALSQASNYTSGNSVILKFDQSGDDKWVTLFNTEIITSIDCDIDNSIYITGVGTYNSNLTLNNDPTLPETSQNLTNSTFIAKFNSDNTLILYETIGRSFEEYSFEPDLTITTNNEIVATGSANSGLVIKSYSNINPNSMNFPTAPYINSNNIPTAGFISKIAASGNDMGKLIWSSYFGSKLEDKIFDVCSDNNGSIYIVGSSNGSIFSSNSIIPMPAVNPSNYFCQEDKCGQNLNNDGFIACINTANELVWSTYFGGNGIDGTLVAEIINSKLYIAGSTFTNNGIYSETEEDLKIPIIQYNENNENELFTSVYNSSWQYAARFTLPQLIYIGVQEVQGLRKFNIYPNPAENNINVRSLSGLNAIEKIVITSLSGEMVISINEIDNECTSIDISSLVSGIYIISVFSGIEMFTSKFIKIQ